MQSSLKEDSFLLIRQICRLHNEHQTRARYPTHKKCTQFLFSFREMRVLCFIWQTLCLYVVVSCALHGNVSYDVCFVCEHFLLCPLFEPLNLPRNSCAHWSTDGTPLAVSLLRTAALMAALFHSHRDYLGDSFIAFSVYHITFSLASVILRRSSAVFIL